MKLSKTAEVRSVICLKCEIYYEPSERSSYALCHNCLIRFDTQKMMGRIVRLENRKSSTVYYENALDWALANK